MLESPAFRRGEYVNDNIAHPVDSSVAFLVREGIRYEALCVLLRPVELASSDLMASSTKFAGHIRIKSAAVLVDYVQRHVVDSCIDRDTPVEFLQMGKVVVKIVHPVEP